MGGHNGNAKTSDVYAIVTQQIISLIEQTGTLPWQRPWSNPNDVAMRWTGKPYRGINVFLLAIYRQIGGYKSNLWLGFKQITEAGGTVRKGEHGHMITWSAQVPIKNINPNTGVQDTDKPYKKISLLRYMRVWNLDQTEGVKLTKRHKAELAAAAKAYEGNVLDDAEAIIASYLATDGAPTLTEGGDSAHYAPSTDTVNIPPRGTFVSAEAFYDALFHEVGGHASGHASRLNRPDITEAIHFGSEQYAFGELVAQMTAAFLDAQAGITTTINNSAAYVKGWLTKLRSDPMMVVKAAGLAQRAADLVLGTTFDNDEGEGEAATAAA